MGQLRSWTHDLHGHSKLLDNVKWPGIQGKYSTFMRTTIQIPCEELAARLRTILEARIHTLRVNMDSVEIFVKNFHLEIPGNWEWLDANNKIIDRAMALATRKSMKLCQCVDSDIVGINVVTEGTVVVIILCSNGCSLKLTGAPVDGDDWRLVDQRTKIAIVCNHNIVVEESYN